MASLAGSSVGGFAAEAEVETPPQAAPNQFEDGVPQQPGVESTPPLPGPLSLQALVATSRFPMPVAEGFLMALGCTVADSVADFSFIPPDELNNALRSFTVGGVEASALQRGQMTRLVAEVHRLCPGPRTVDEIISSAAQAAKQAAQAAAPPVASIAFPSPPDAAPTRPKRKFADTLDQGDDQLFEELAPAEVAELREEQIKVTGGPPA